MTQSQRESLLDLLIIGIFVDAKLTVAEDAALEAALQSIGWEGNRPRDVFICRSLNRARRARESEVSTGLYIASRAIAFTDEASREKALELLQKVFAADGVADSEAEFLARVKARFL